MYNIIIEINELAGNLLKSFARESMIAQI